MAQNCSQRLPSARVWKGSSKNGLGGSGIPPRTWESGKSQNGLGVRDIPTHAPTHLYTTPKNKTMKHFSDMQTLCKKSLENGMYFHKKVPLGARALLHQYKRFRVEVQTKNETMFRDTNFSHEKHLFTAREHTGLNFDDAAHLKTGT